REYDFDQDPLWQTTMPPQAFDTIAWYHCDHLGTPMELTDPHGNVAWAGQYKAWGEVREERSEWAKQHGLSNPIRFQGQYHDHETGLHYNRHRYYDTRGARFICKDPISYAGGLNQYVYAPNPISWIDPLGLAKECCCGAKGLGNATEAGSVFTQQRNFWSKDPIQFSGNKVYQRNDLFDPNLQTSWREGGKVITGSNAERMASGRAPIGVDGKSVNLHHMTQTQSGPIAEMTQSFHQTNSATIHINPNIIPSGSDRAAFDKWKVQYWKQRPADFRN
ncbi:RHS repeat-associated core domain-containing protein, partial [Pseudomonas sp. KCJK9044]|uniref:RHS repeat-associated core domain-containing protein n=2 Tax=unclassified Pseudomonas TaxID=196821 RepID=UPI0039068093